MILFYFIFSFDISAISAQNFFFFLNKYNSAIRFVTGYMFCGACTFILVM